MKRQYVVDLCRHVATANKVVVFSDYLTPQRGRSSPEYKDSRVKLDRQQILALVGEVDSCHAKGETITNRKIRSFVECNFGIKMARQTMAKYFKKLGLKWKNVKCKKRNLGNYRMDVLRTYLIELDKLVKEYKADKDNCPFVVVCTDESYIHKNHAGNFTYLTDDAFVNRKASKGDRVVIMHAITHEGPLCERDNNNKPIDDLVWRGDTCHSTKRNDGRLTCETLWKASSRSGDYHDNMNSEMFMQWTVDKLIPTFERLYPGKQMILVMDNAPYHHKREVGLLASKTKRELIDFCIKHDFEYLDLPYTAIRHEAILNDESIVDQLGILVIDEDTVRVEFDDQLFLERASSAKPWSPTIDELKFGFWMLTIFKRQ